MRADRTSSTATLIAAATVFLARDRRICGLVSPEAATASARCLRAASPAAAAVVDAISRPGGRWLARLAERATVPGLMLHFMARKRHIEETVRALVAQAARQVVVIGAGFDTLALRLQRDHPGLRCLEIDHPATQRCKREALASGGPSLHFVAADLARQRLADVLRAEPAFHSDMHTVFVLEGLLMYLPRPAVDAVFDALAEAHRARADAVFTVMEPAPDGRLAFHNATLLEKWLLSVWREPFRSALGRSEIGALLDSHGYRLTAVADAGMLRTRYLEPLGLEAEPLAVGEIVVTAERHP